MENMKEYYRLSEVAKMLGVSYVTMWRWCNDGLVATVELPSKQRRILSAEVKRLLAQPEAQEA
jgi:predicted site-specific integrase-resolvase